MNFFSSNIRYVDILSNEDLDFVKALTKKMALSSYQTYNNNVLQNLSKDECLALQNLPKSKELFIQKSIVHHSDQFRWL